MVGYSSKTLSFIMAKAAAKKPAAKKASKKK